MVFSSLTFLFFFFPAVLALYYVCPRRGWRNAVLLLASLLFYSWGEPKNIILLLSATAIAYAGGILMQKALSFPKRRRCVLIVTVVLLLANLFTFKYLNLVSSLLSKLFATLEPTDIALPIGISFYTFQILSYVIDLYRNEIELQRSPLRLLMYVSFFPQLIAGPIVRYKTIENEIGRRQETLDEVSAGLRRFIVGLAKKVLVANNVAALAETIYAGSPAVYGTTMYWLAALAYTLQIYFDFSGYSDMAVGMGRMFGFHFLENFDHPYIALSVTDFWRRWHISLSSWFRDYVYIPLGGNRVNRPRWIFNLLVVWGLTGLWHGASWNFPLWGLYYGLLLIMEKLFWGRALERLPKLLRWLYTFFIVNLGWVLFNRTQMSQLKLALFQMFTPVPTDYIGAVAADSSIFTALVWIPLGLICMLPLGKYLQRAGHENMPEFIKNTACALLLAVCVVFLISSTYNPFIYFRF